MFARFIYLNNNINKLISKTRVNQAYNKIHKTVNATCRKITLATNTDSTSRHFTSF